MLYYQPGSDVVWTERPPDDKWTSESFEPTRRDLKEGFLLWMDYTTYDSFSSSNERDYCIVDLYEQYKSAEKMAKLIREYLDAEYRYNKGREQSEIEKDFFFAATSDRTPYLPLGWGNADHRIYVDEVSIQDISEKMKRQRIF